MAKSIAFNGAYAPSDWTSASAFREMQKPRIIAETWTCSLSRQTAITYRSARSGSMRETGTEILNPWARTLNIRAWDLRALLMEGNDDEHQSDR
jgi:hypothetical protein